MPIYDEITTDARYEALKQACTRRKPLKQLEPKAGLEPATYALRVRCSAD